MFKRQNSITSLTGESFQSIQGMGGFQMVEAFPFYSFSTQVSEEKKTTHGSVCTDQWPPPSARRLSCQDNCCQDMLVFLGNNFSVLFLYSKPSPMSMRSCRSSSSLWRLGKGCRGRQGELPKGNLWSQRDLHKLCGLSDCTLKTEIPKPRAGSLFKAWDENEFPSL